MRFWATLFCSLAMVGSTAAQDLTLLRSSKPISYRADRCRYSAHGQKASCTGRVVITREDLEIRCDKLDAQMDRRGRIRHLSCEGHVEIITEQRVARSQRAHFDADHDQLTLDGEARVAQGQSRLAGRAIHIDLRSGDISVEGRVRGILGPDVVRPVRR